MPHGVALRLRADHRRLFDEVSEAFAKANEVYETSLGALRDELSVLLARLLHYQTEADFVDLPGLNRALLDWRADVDQSFLRHMGLAHDQAEVVQVSGPTWRVERPADYLPVSLTARQTTVRFVHDQDGYVLWGIDGFRYCLRQQLRPEADGGFSATATVPLPAAQVNFTLETADGRWRGEFHTLWLDKKGKG